MYISVTKPCQTIYLFHNIPLWSLLHSGIRMSHLRSLWHRWLCVDKVTKSKVTVEKQRRKMVHVLWNAGVHESANPVRIRLSINFSWYRNTSYDSIWDIYFIFIYSITILAEFSVFTGIWNNGFTRSKIYCYKPLGSISPERFSNCFERSQKIKSVDKTFKTQID